MRHDYGLDKHPDDASFVAGMTGTERNALWKQMAQIFDNDIAPNMVFKTPDPIYVAQVEEHFKNQHNYSE
jgi:hypothetical protein